MTTPFYVSPEQLMKDRADYVRKNIARGGSVAVLNYDGGILFVAENRSRVLHKISEIYDRVGFAAAGKYNEFENLRQAGVRLADTRGYLYDRRDVSALGLANAYAQTLGTIFSEAGGKPYEVELIIAEVGDRPEQDQIYRLTYDGSVADAHGFVVIGGAAEEVSRVLEGSYVEGAHLGAAASSAAWSARNWPGCLPTSLVRTRRRSLTTATVTATAPTGTRAARPRAARRATTAAPARPPVARPRRATSWMTSTTCLRTETARTMHATEPTVPAEVRPGRRHGGLAARGNG